MRRHRDTCAARSLSAMGDVHRDFHAEAKINRLRCFPFHLDLLRSFAVEAGPDGPAGSSSRSEAAADSGSS
jgi:hypothetical protein